MEVVEIMFVFRRGVFLKVFRNGVDEVCFREEVKL